MVRHEWETHAKWGGAGADKQKRVVDKCQRVNTYLLTILDVAQEFS